MLQLFRAPTPAIGLDVGAESIKLLQLATGPSGVRVLAALRVPIPADVKGDPDRRVAFAEKTVRDALRRRAFSGNRVMAAVPKELLHYKTHRLLPPTSADELSLAARIDARDLFRFEPNATDVQVLDAGEIRHGEERRREVILVAAGKQFLDQFATALHRAGARVESLDIDPCLIWRAAHRVPPRDEDAAHPRVVIDVGAAQSRLVIGRGEDVRVIKTIDVGADHLRSAISRKLGLSEAEAQQLRRRPGGENLDGIRKVLTDATRHATETLAREALMCVRYHAVTFRGPAPRRIELVGGEASDPQIRSMLAATLLLPVKPLDVLRGIDTTAIAAADRTASLGEWAVALGLALKGTPNVPRAAACPSEQHVEAAVMSSHGSSVVANAAAAAAAAVTAGGKS